MIHCPGAIVGGALCCSSEVFARAIEEVRQLVSSHCSFLLGCARGYMVLKMLNSYDRKGSTLVERAGRYVLSWLGCVLVAT